MLLKSTTSLISYFLIKFVNPAHKGALLETNLKIITLCPVNKDLEIAREIQSGRVKYFNRQVRRVLLGSTPKTRLILWSTSSQYLMSLGHFQWRWIRSSFDLHLAHVRESCCRDRYWNPQPLVSGSIFSCWLTWDAGQLDNLAVCLVSLETWTICSSLELSI